MSLTKRIYVGNIHKNIEKCTEALYERFKQFGKCISPSFECHSTFAYVTMEFESIQDFNKLKSNLHNVKFMSNRLCIDTAKETWKERWERENQDTKLESAKERELLNQQWEYYKRIQNIKMSWVDRRDVMLGRMRKTPRDKYKLKKATFRVNVKGQLKVYKCYKDKLWGYERNKLLSDLVFKFVQNYWKDSNNHIVDKLDYSRANKFLVRRFAPGEQAASKQLANGQEADDVEDDLALEAQKNTDILSSVLNNFDFAKPLDLEEADLAGAMFNSQPSNKRANISDYNNDSEIEVEGSNDSKEKDHVHSTKETLFDREPTNNDEEEEEEEEKFMPTFGKPQGSSVKPQNVNDTETLRSVFNPQADAQTTFRLLTDADDTIDYDKNTPEEDVIQPTVETGSATVSPASLQAGRGLFFPHFESPFLAAQSQLSKVQKTSNIEDRFASWEETFWDNRAAWTRQMKLKKRDALWKQKKKSGKGLGNINLL
ncbi:HEL197Wp [Eremothecium sinecaudum]|uniref:HEL197Wp n=1 Tax=Eremothecium sinecaudum TaxID=45286 RepID=A0A0X8HTC4_9SACH|nr:HEL197Wp [Eremothecium sinecaudum]AMD21084.1 HEL197Wp [Eremothecium sinecaudum]